MGKKLHLETQYKFPDSAIMLGKKLSEKRKTNIFEGGVLEGLAKTKKQALLASNLNLWFKANILLQALPLSGRERVEMTFVVSRFSDI